MFEEPVRFMLDVFQTNRSGSRFAVRQRHVRESGARQALRHAEAAGPADAWVRVPDAERVSARRPAADGGIPHQERTRPANESGEARQLGGEERARRAHFTAAAEACLNCRGRNQAGSAAARRDGAASLRSAVRVLPREVRRARPGVRRLRSDRRATHHGSRRPAGRRLGDVPRRQRGRRRRRTAHATFARTGSATLSTISARKLLAYALGRSLAAHRRAA